MVDELRQNRQVRHSKGHFFHVSTAYTSTLVLIVFSRKFESVHSRSSDSRKYKINKSLNSLIILKYMSDTRLLSWGRGRVNLEFSSVRIRTLSWGPVVSPPNIFENAICVSAHFKYEKHQFILYRRAIFEGLLFVDV